MKQIPVHLLKDRTSLGLQLKRLQKDTSSTDDEDVRNAHRDDHYIFFLLESSSDAIMVDFNHVPLPDRSLYYLLPNQVHQWIHHEAAEGWFIAVDTALVPPECRNVFESPLLLQQPRCLNEIQLKQCKQIVALLFEKYRENAAGAFYMMTVHALLRSFLAFAAACYNGWEGMNFKVSRPAQLTAQFKDLLGAEIRAVKSPVAFAAKLNVSEAYLSEAIKKTTGFPISYWIQQEIMMEAKRLLYYSHLTVKEVAHHLGYEDHSYFSRLFRKVTGTSAMTFREQYRK